MAVSLAAALSAQQLPSEPQRQFGTGITGAFEGWFDNPGGGRLFLIGYLNRNTEQELDVAIGPNNRIEPGGPDMGQPTHFLPGRQWGVFVIPVPKEFTTADQRFTWTIVVNGQIYGYVWIIADGSPLSELEQMAVESGSTIAALMLLRDEKVQREEAVERGDLVARLLSGKAAEREDWFADRAMRYGLNLRAPYRVVVVDGLKAPLKEGMKVPLTLRFQKAGDVKVELRVRALGASAHPMHMH